MNNPLDLFLSNGETVVLDGAMATELEARGLDLNDDLWSAKVLIENAEAIAAVHLDYLQAGADCIITSGYQASVPGFVARGLNAKEAEHLLHRSIQLATETRDRFWQNTDHPQRRRKPLVAASIGPYGAFLANGAEYTGDYDLDEDALVDWHRSRWALSVASNADLLACETIPSITEARAYIRLLREFPQKQAWLSFSCRDGVKIADGTPLSAVADLLTGIDNIAAIGINCTSPNHISSLIAVLTRASTKPIIVYPNSGETYHADTKTWTGTANPADYATATQDWSQLGATIIGGCCRTTPDHVRAIRKHL